MKLIKHIALLAALIPLSACAQSGVYFTGRTTTVSKAGAPGMTAPVLAVPYAQITVYPLGASTLAPLYADAGLGVPATNPYTADGSGNFGFYVAAGQYTYTMVDANGLPIGGGNFTAGGTSSVVLTQGSIAAVGTLLNNTVGTAANTTQVNGATLPALASVAGTNASGQVVSSTSANIVSALNNSPTTTLAASLIPDQVLNPSISVVASDSTGNSIAATGAGVVSVIGTTPVANATNATQLNGAAIPISAPCTGTNASGQVISVACGSGGGGGAPSGPATGAYLAGSYPAPVFAPQPKIYSDSNTTPSYMMQFTSTNGTGTGIQPGSTGISAGYNCLGTWTASGTNTWRATAVCSDTSSQIYTYRTSAAATFGSESWTNSSALFTSQFYVNGYLNGTYLYGTGTRGVRASSAFLDFNSGARLVGSGSNSTTYGSSKMLAETSTGTAGASFTVAGDNVTGTATSTVPVVLPAAPTTSLQAATKGYVDSAISSGGALPAATAAGQVPVSNGAGTAYTSRALVASDITPGATPALDILGQGSGTPTLPANMPTYFTGYLAAQSGTPGYLIQESAAPVPGLTSLTGPVTTTFNLAGGGTTTLPVYTRSQTTLSGDPTQIAYLNGGNSSLTAFTIPSGCTSGSTTWWSMNGLQGRCNGYIYHSTGYEEWDGTGVYDVFKTITLFTHLGGANVTPTAAAGAGASACTIAGNDVDFTLTITGNGTAGTLCTVTFGQAFVSTAPRIVFSANNAASATAMASVYKTTSLTAMTFTTSAALTGSLVWDFHVAN